MIQRTLFLILLVSLTVNVDAKSRKRKKSLLRSVRNFLLPVLSEHNIANWNRRIQVIEGTLNNEPILDDSSQQHITQPSDKDKCTFADVAGGVPQEITNLLEHLQNSEKFKKFNIAPPRGVLLVGPPGTGKTLLARALAGQAKCGFLATSATQFIEVFVGTGPARVRELFERAQYLAQTTHKKVIIFIDEIDALGSRNNLAGHDSESKRTLNEFLTQMDGFVQNNNIIILAATNNAQDLDPALKRAGRFDTIIEIPLPDKEQREAVLKHYFNRIPTGRVSPEINCDILAENSKGFNNADLEELVRKASVFAANENVEQITQKHAEAALQITRKQKKY